MKDCINCKWDLGGVCENTKWKTGKPIDHLAKPVCGYATSLAETPKGWSKLIKTAVRPREVRGRDLAGYYENTNPPEFDSQSALAALLIEEVIFLNSLWWMGREGWPKPACEKVALCVNCGDIFAWGVADAHPLDYKDLQRLYDMWVKDPQMGPAVFCCIMRKQMPQAPVAKQITAMGIWDLSTMDLAPNYYDAARAAQKKAGD